MRARLTLGVARRLIVDAPWAQERLRPYAGHEIAWNIAGLCGAVVLDEQGLPSARAMSANPADDGQTGPACDPAGPRHAGLRIRLESEDLAALSGGFDALMRRVAIEGNAGLAS